VRNGAFSAPLARALIGARVGDQLEFGGKTDAIEIVSLGDAHLPTPTQIPAGS
jgi:hypothetical protein